MTTMQATRVVRRLRPLAGGLGWRMGRAALVAGAAPGLLRLLAGRYDSSPRTSRRDFLRWTVGGASVFFLAEAAAGFVAFFWPIKFGTFGTRITLKPEQIPAVGAPPTRIQDGRCWLINNEDGALALYWRCVHLGCTVPWNNGEGQFHCPCHASLYNRQGVVVGGPAPRPLDIMRIEVVTSDAGVQVVVNTGEITMREGYSPEQAVRLPG